MVGQGLISATGVACLWLGVVIAIAIEASVKFKAKSLTRAIGLDVGRHVFAAIGIFELCLLAAVLVLTWNQQFGATVWVWVAVLGLMVALQAAWLRPILNARAAAIIAGDAPTERWPHLAYVGLEGVKFIALVALTIVARPHL